MLFILLLVGDNSARIAPELCADLCSSRLPCVTRWNIAFGNVIYFTSLVYILFSACAAIQSETSCAMGVTTCQCQWCTDHCVTVATQCPGDLSCTVAPTPDPRGQSGSSSATNMTDVGTPMLTNNVPAPPTATLSTGFSSAPQTSIAPTPLTPLSSGKTTTAGSAPPVNACDCEECVNESLQAGATTPAPTPFNCGDTHDCPTCTSMSSFCYWVRPWWCASVVSDNVCAVSSASR
jgi:hypothetical protein